MIDLRQKLIEELTEILELYYLPDDGAVEIIDHLLENYDVREKNEKMISMCPICKKPLIFGKSININTIWYCDNCFVDTTNTRKEKNE